MKSTIYASAIALLLPIALFAASTDVTLYNDVEIALGNITFTVSSGKTSTMDSISVDTDSFTLTMSTDTYVRVVSTSKRTLTFSTQGTVEVTAGCSSSESSYIITNPISGTSQTITATLSGSTCTSSTAGGG